MESNRYLKMLGVPQIFGVGRTKEILDVNPTVIPFREEAAEISVFVYDYDADDLKEFESASVDDCLAFKTSNRLSWINIDGLRKADVETVCNHFGIHALLIEDILSVNQRPKMDEVEGVMFCLLNMLYYNDVKKTVETEQISIVLGKDFVISFQEDATRDVFNPLRINSGWPEAGSASAQQIIFAMRCSI